MDECIDSLATAKVFSTIYCNSGYCQMLIKEYDRHKTPVFSHHGLYQFKRMPFSLRISSALLQRAIATILSSVRLKAVRVYLDEVIVFWRNVEENLDKL